MLTLINMGFHCFDYFASLLLNPLDILLVFDFGLFSLHLVSDIRIIALLFRAVLRVAQFINSRQLSLLGIDPFLGSNLPIALIFDVNPLS